MHPQYFYQLILCQIGVLPQIPHLLYFRAVRRVVPMEYFILFVILMATLLWLRSLTEQ